MKNVTKEYIIENCISQAKGRTACLKRAVYAIIIAEDGKEVFGSNWTNSTNVTECPRADYATGEGYHLCKEICSQEYHAEVEAVLQAQKKEVIIYNAKMYLTGHDYCCNNCLDIMRSSGIKYAKCLDSGKEYNL